MLDWKEVDLLRYIVKRTSEKGSIANGVSWQELTFHFYTKKGHWEDRTEFIKALDDLTDRGILQVNSEGVYNVSNVWLDTNSDILSIINKKTGIFEMKHLKTFEHFDVIQDPNYAVTICPLCHSDNVMSLGNGDYDCIDCGEHFSEEFEPAAEMEDDLEQEMQEIRQAEELDREDEYEEDEEEEDPEIPQGEYEEEEEDFLDTPEVSAAELSNYESESAEIEKIIANAQNQSVELADQLEFEAESSDSITDFLKRAEACIQDILGVDREEAISILNSLRMQQE